MAEVLKPQIQDSALSNVTATSIQPVDYSDSIVTFAKALTNILDTYSKNEVRVEPEIVSSPEETVISETPVAKLLKEEGISALDTPDKSTSVADTTLPIEAKAFLDTLAKHESRGYNIIVGEGKYGAQPTFSDYTKHPNIVGMRTVHGPSTAAGRYQFVYSTWKDLQKKYPGQFIDFTPATQDRAAWRYAQDVYKSRTGNELLTDLKQGNIKRAQVILKNIWIGLGHDPDVTKTYNKAFERYKV